MSTTKQHTEALAQIELIQNTIQNSNKFLFSGRKILIIGIILCLVPFFELAFDRLLVDTGQISQIVIRIVVYSLISVISIKLFSAKKTEEQTRLPASLHRAFALHEVILNTLAFIDIALACSAHYDLILPINMILLGLLFNLFSIFTIKLLHYISWSYIILGIINIALSNYLASNAWIFELYYLGITYIVIGLILERHNNA